MTSFLFGMAACAVLFQRLDVALAWGVAAALWALLSEMRRNGYGRAGR